MFCTLFTFNHGIGRNKKNLISFDLAFFLTKGESYHPKVDYKKVSLLKLSNDVSVALC